MALKACRACGKQVSPSASACPACGHPLGSRSVGVGGCCGLVVLGSLLLLLSALAVPRPGRDAPDSGVDAPEVVPALVPTDALPPGRKVALYRPGAAGTTPLATDSGRVAEIPNGTQAEILRRDVGTYRVRIDEGPEKGQEGDVEVGSVHPIVP